MSRIIELQAENFKRIVAASIRPTSDLVVIGGRNGQGKSSLLDAITVAIGGAKEMPEQPIREGQKHAKVTLLTDDGFKISRVWTEVGSHLVVENGEKMRASAPQQVLDRMTGKLAFDPVSFLRLKPAEQRDALQKLVGLDLSEENRQRDTIFSERTVTNRQLDAAAAVLHSMPQPIPVSEAVNISDVLSELDQAEKVNRAAAEAADAAKTARELVLEQEMVVGGIQSHIAQIKEDIAKLEKALALMTQEVGEAEAKVVEYTKAAEAALVTAQQAPKVDVAPIKAKLANAEAINQQVRANADRAKQEQAVKALKAKSDEMTEAIAHIDATKARKLRETKFPVEGLSFDERGVTFNGRPFSQASSAEQLRVSVAMGAALNPRLRIMIVKDGSLLDEDSLAALEAMAAELDCQVWIERVGKGAECSVVIEDGSVVGAAREGNAA